MSSASKIGFIGAGNMAEAIIKGLAGNDKAKPDISAYDPNEERLHLLEQNYGVRAAASNSDLVKSCDIIFLAVKPQIFGKVLKEINTEFSAAKLLLSIMAGISTARIEEQLSEPPRLIRAMPNTPALVGQGATALCAGSAAQKGDMDTAGSLFSAIGPVFEVSEAQMDAVTGLSGSGPAYVFSFIEALADGGVLNGLPRETALELAIQTVIGAATLVKNTGEHPAMLRDKVCSPGGTTIAGVKALEANSFRNAIMEAVTSATRRSRELGNN
ncbi:MAG: pyrroline-5-carboxylate reductase [Deltaproteobacteria bacterium]|nr:pyrroline-5-carboxylate reductase [Deltaproteobacteria bacterium]